ncbi:MAG TPA: ester cyclase [Vicinamibacterales bacterium]|nr:ester cyclase [Vicinamibacterales bacterium]
MTRQQIESLFAHRDRAIDRRDAHALTALYAEDAIVESPTAGGAVQGRKAIEDVTRAWFDGFPDMTFTSGTLVIDGDRAVSIGEVCGPDTGGFMGLPPTNKPFHLPMVFVCTLSDGVVVHEQRIYDFTGMLLQIGVLKAKPV